MRGLGAAVLLALAAAPAGAQDRTMAEQRAEWNQPMAPFRIAGNVHSVGTAGVAAYLLTDAAGHVLIDGGMEESAPLIAANIRSLGFRLEDVRVILVNHAHWDHSGGVAALKRMSGARLLASGGDRPELESGRVAYRDDISPAPPVAVDAVIADGEEIRVGATRLVTHLTPGHTKGCTSWTTTVATPAGPRSMIFACSLSVADQRLTGDDGYPEAAADFRASFAKLLAIPADIYLSFHPFTFDMEEKHRKLAAGDADAFVDPSELRRRVNEAERAFEAELARQNEIRTSAQ